MVLSESVLDQNGPNDHFGQNYLIPNRALAFASQNAPRRSVSVHFGLKGPFRTVIVFEVGRE